MASAIIHLAVAKELEKYFNITNKFDYYIGSIAPDIAKQIDKPKHLTHFSTKDKCDFPDINKFTSTYPNFYKYDFDLGYYIHLYTDKIWYEEFEPTFASKDYIKLLNGTYIPRIEDEFCKLVYENYKNLNIKLLDYYNLNLNIFYDNFTIPLSSIDIFPLEELPKLLDEMGILIENSQDQECLLFNFEQIKDFIKTTVQKIKE